MINETITAPNHEQQNILMFVDAATQCPEPSDSANINPRRNSRRVEELKKNKCEWQKWLKIALVALLASSAVALVSMINGETFTVSSFAIRVSTGTGGFLITLIAWRVLNQTWDSEENTLIKKSLITIFALAAAGAAIAATSLTYTSFFGLTPNWTMANNFWKAMASGSASVGLTFAFTRAMRSLDVTMPQSAIMIERQLIPMVPGQSPFR